MPKVDNNGKTGIGMPIETRKTKIVATIGPASNSEQAIEELLAAGVNVFRLNLSHGTLSEHKRSIANVRAAAKKLKHPAAILMDLQGPRIRTGIFKDGSIELKPRSEVTIVPGEASADDGVITTTYSDLSKDVKPGDRILIDDGLLELKVKEVAGEAIKCVIVYGGILKSNKGINLPGVSISAPSLSDKDIEGLELAASLGIDFVALSFVRKSSDILELKERLKKHNSDASIIAKIEKAEAIDDLDAILEESDGIMIARGDLGVELSAETIPVLQKKLISRANEAGKVVITATQMLESMITNPRPTRAEASDVANAVFDGTDALMLSGETAVGKYPVKAVEMMVKIAREAEEAAIAHRPHLRRKKVPLGSFAQAVAYAANAASTEVNSKAIVVFTQSGETARLLSKLKPHTRIVAFTPIERTWRRLSLLWGVEPFLIEFGGHTDEMICRGEAALLDYGIAAFGDTIVIVSGTKVGMRGATNMMKIDWIGSEECKLYIKDGGTE